MARKYDVVAITGEYTNKQGQPKKRYQSVGMVLEKDGKFYLKMNSLVTVDDKGQVVNFFSLYTPKGAAADSKPAPQQDDAPPFDDDLPF